MSRNLIYNDEGYIPPLAFALIVIFIIIIVASFSPGIKQTIIDIASAIFGN